MQIHFLGTTGYHPNAQRQTMCVMIPALGIVFDAGTGFFRVREHLQTRDLNILLSHAHLDHVIGLSFLFDVLYQKDATAHVYALPDKLTGLADHLFHPTLFPVRPPYREHALGLLDGGAASPDPQRSIAAATANTESAVRSASAVGGEFILSCGTHVRWFPVEHPGGAIGFRLRLPSGHSVAYVTDTTASTMASYRSEIEGVDLLIHECYFDDGAEDHARLTGHSCLTPVLDLVRDCRPKRTALVHLNPLTEWAPPLDKVRRLAAGLSVSVPADGDILTL
jgi:ribonuclease BN (tRNA processing enzyme)